jgi:hypothetical protein
MIEEALMGNWTVTHMATQLEADHSTDDAESEFNYKTCLVSKIYNPTEKYH